MVDLWIMQSNRFLQTALEEGFRKFAWHMHQAIKSRWEILSWLRSETAAYGPIDVMIIDDSGAAEYNTFSNYLHPKAVYPAWTAQDMNWDELVWLMKNPVGQNFDMCNDPNIPTEMRPVFGQDHKIVVHTLPKAGVERQTFISQLHALQKGYPDVIIHLSGVTRFSDLFGLSFKSVDYLPISVAVNGMYTGNVHLPTGKKLGYDNVYDRRYADWFKLVGMDQIDVISNEGKTLFCLRSARWANKNFERVTPFVSKRGNAKFPAVEVMSGMHEVSDQNFILPAARRRLMRNLGLDTTELDMFTCDTCILHNACKLYREGSVCTVKGSEAVALADSFGTRNAQVIIGGLTELLKRNAERLEDAMAREEEEGELDPNVTALGDKVFNQGVKLAKLIDPSLAGGAKVQVNVGVAGSANVSVGQSNSKELMASIVAELEAAGIPRDKIDGDMIKGVLRTMAQSTQKQAISTAAAKYEVENTSKVIEA